MWVLKVKFDSRVQFNGRLAIKHKVSMTGYPLSYHKDKKWMYLMLCGFMFGPEKNKKAVLRDLKRQGMKVEMENDFIITENRQPLYLEPLYDPRIIRTKPTIINYKEKCHTWEIASFDKEVLTKAFSIMKKHLKGRLLKFKKEKISNISILRMIPKLTEKQKKALEIAINNGYYSYPKKVKMEKLAKLMGCSYSTYQAHLKKAEGKLIPHVYKEL